MKDIITQDYQPFDYSGLTPEQLEIIQSAKAEIAESVEQFRAVVGSVLLRAYEKLPYDVFNNWSTKRYNISRTTVWRYMQDAQGKIEHRINTTTVSEMKPFFSLDQHGMGQSEVVTWNTPVDLVMKVEAFLGNIDLDPCSNSYETPNVPATTHYTIEDDGLKHRWHGKVYLNPPYGREIGEWVRKLVRDYEDGNIQEAIALVPGRMDTEWFQPLHNYLWCCIVGRVHFSDGVNGAPFPVF